MQKLTEEYGLLRRLGEGGMGEVWEAARLKPGGVVVPCAIKLLHGDFTETSRERELFFDEARIATQLDHSRIVKIIDIGTAPARIGESGAPTFGGGDGYRENRSSRLPGCSRGRPAGSGASSSARVAPRRLRPRITFARSPSGKGR